MEIVDFLGRLLVVAGDFCDSAFRAGAGLKSGAWAVEGAYVAVLAGVGAGAAAAERVAWCMAERLIPRQDALALAWMRTFADGVAADVGQFMRSRAEADALLDVVARFASSYATAMAPGTRTADAIRRKDEDRVDAEGLCRLIAVQIKHNAGVSDASKIAIGARPVNYNRVRRECPQSSPVISVVASTPGAQTLTYHDSLSPHRRARPMGATSLQLYVVVSDRNATSPADAKYVGSFTRGPISVSFDPGDRGKQATFFARWSGKRGQHGNWSLPTSMTVAA